MKSTASLLLLCALAACEQDPVQDPSTLPHLEFKVGEAQGRIPFKEVICEQTVSHEHYKLMSPRPLKTKRTNQIPAVLIARVKIHVGAWSKSSGEGGATAFIPEFETEGAKYPLTMVAEDAQNGSNDYHCTIERKGPMRKIQCANAAILPWYSAGALPKGAFRAEFSCSNP